MLFLSYAVCVERLLSFGQQILRFIRAKGLNGIPTPEKTSGSFAKKIQMFQTKDTYLSFERYVSFCGAVAFPLRECSRRSK